jgi:peptidyl-prolyl cis-trans isomerase-like 4
MNDVGAAVLFDTSLGPLVIDLYCRRAPRACENFLTLAASGYFTNDIFYNVVQNGYAEVGNVGGKGGSHIYADHEPRGFMPEGLAKPYPIGFGTVLMVANESMLHTSIFVISLSDTKMRSLAESCTILGTVSEGKETTLRELNRVIIGKNGKPMRRVRIRAAYVLGCPFPSREGNTLPTVVMDTMARHPGYLTTVEDLPSDADAETDETEEEIAKRLMERQMRKQQYMLQLLGDIPPTDITTPDNILFVCKLNPLTGDADLSQFFSQFGEVKSCDVIRDPTTRQSLQYAFVEFATVEGCRKAYSMADNVLVDDRRIHVDFSQSVKHLWKSARRSQREDPKRQKN